MASNGDRRDGWVGDQGGDFCGSRVVIFKSRIKRAKQIVVIERKATVRNDTIPGELAVED